VQQNDDQAGDHYRPEGETPAIALLSMAPAKAK
jgi:hypothetical protein